MSIKLEYIVCNKKGDELKRFTIKTEAEAYDSVICAAEDISLLLEPLQQTLSLTDDQIYHISEHLAFQSDELKLALKQIKKNKLINTQTLQMVDSSIKEIKTITKKQSIRKKTVQKSN
jgi:dsDNA-binding SOS-regulon protein